MSRFNQMNGNCSCFNGPDDFLFRALDKPENFLGPGANLSPGGPNPQAIQITLTAGSVWSFTMSPQPLEASTLSTKSAWVIL